MGVLRRIPALVGRSRRKQEKLVAVKIVKKFVHDPDVEFYFLHWDSKKIKKADGCTEERLAILLTL